MQGSRVGVIKRLQPTDRDRPLWGSGFTILFRVERLPRFGGEGFRCKAKGSGFRMQGCRDQGVGFRVQGTLDADRAQPLVNGSGFRVSVARFRV